MTSFEAMVAEAKAAADRRASLVPLAHLKEASRLVPGAISALSSLRTDDRAVTVIAEVKRSTATFADLSGVGDPGMLACFYAAGGAACVSVVTGPSATRGSLKDLDAVRGLGGSSRPRQRPGGHSLPGARGPGSRRRSAHARCPP